MRWMMGKSLIMSFVSSVILSDALLHCTINRPWLSVWWTWRCCVSSGQTSCSFDQRPNGHSDCVPGVRVRVSTDTTFFFFFFLVYLFLLNWLINTQRWVHQRFWHRSFFSFVCLCCHLLGPVKTCWLKIWAMLVIIGHQIIFVLGDQKLLENTQLLQCLIVGLSWMTVLSPVCFFSLNSTFYAAAFIVLLLMPMKMTVIIIIHRNAPSPIIIWTPWCILVKLC